MSQMAEEYEQSGASEIIKGTVRELMGLLESYL